MSAPHTDAPHVDAYALLESSFSASPHLLSHKPPLRRSDSARRTEPAAEKKETLWQDDETDSLVSSALPTPLEPPPAVTANGTEHGLPPTPPTNSQDGLPPNDYSPPSQADGVMTSLTSRKSTLSTPVNQRSPPTPDPSPPRRPAVFMTTPVRPVSLALDSSRTESYATAREEPVSSAESSRSNTPLGSPTTIVVDDRGLGLAFERAVDDTIPQDAAVGAPPETATRDVRSGPNGKDDLHVADVPNREWDTNMMRNVTVCRTRKPSPQKKPASPEPASPAPAPIVPTTPRRSTSLRERVEASRQSPHTVSVENFAKSIGWPTENTESSPGQVSAAELKRLSGASMSTVVEAMVVVTPPQRRQTLRHSGKNLAYRRDAESPTGSRSGAYSRASLQSEDIPLHRLVHKKATVNNKGKRYSSDSAATLADRTASPASLRQRAEESAAVTMSHQKRVKSVLQPAADIMSRSNSVNRHQPHTIVHKRISSAPEAMARTRTPSSSLRDVFMGSPSASPSPRRDRRMPSNLAHMHVSSSPVNDHHDRGLPKSPPVKSPRTTVPGGSPNMNRSLPDVPVDHPIQHTKELSHDDSNAVNVVHDQEAQLPSNMLNTVRDLLAAEESTQPAAVESPRIEEPTSTDAMPRRGSRSTLARSEGKRRSSLSQDHRSSLDRVPTDELPRTSHEWHSVHTDGNRRVSFDRSTIRTDEHAMARHLFSQTTPFSQTSDTPIEVSEATAVSIYPHNNHSLLVVQQVSRASQQSQQHHRIANNAFFVTSNDVGQEEPLNSRFLDASHTVVAPSNYVDTKQTLAPPPSCPVLAFEPSTPPMQIDLPTFTAVHSPLKNPRNPPEPPIIKFIPPTPAEELERQLQATPNRPGPPERSGSHPQRRLSLKQRARRYSDNIISPFLARASSKRGRSASTLHTGHGQPQVPTVNDEDGSLHPFWRPRGFWEGFDDSESESDEDRLPHGGDTSDVEDDDDDDDSAPPSPRKLGALGRRLTNNLKKPNVFHMGNSLGVERTGSNRRRPHVALPPRGVSSSTRSRSRSHSPAPSPFRSSTSHRDAPKILIRPPTLPFRRTHSARVHKPSNRASLSATDLERSSTWRQGRKIPGLRGVQVQYIGLSGVKQRWRERKADRRREALRRSIGGRWYVEPGTIGGESGGGGGDEATDGDADAT